MLVCDVLWYLFLVALWSPAWKGLTTWLSCLLYFAIFLNMSWTTSELRARSAPWSWFKLSSKIFYWPFQGSTSFVDLLCFFLSCVCYAFVSVCLYVPWDPCWERADLLALVCGVQLWVCCFPIGILGQVWYLIVSIPDLCALTYFKVYTTQNDYYQEVFPIKQVLGA